MKDKIVTNNISEKEWLVILKYEVNFWKNNPTLINYRMHYPNAELMDECPDCGEKTKSLHNIGGGLMCETCCREYSTRQHLDYNYE